MNFTSERMATCCKCDKPATHLILGHPGNVKYARACSRHVAQKVRELERAHGVDERLATIRRNPT